MSGEILRHDLKHVLLLSGDKEQPGKVSMLGANFLLPLIACKSGMVSQSLISASLDALLRIVWRNVATWPGIEKVAAFPNRKDGCQFSCQKFYVEGSVIVLVPCKTIGIGDSPQPHAELTKELKVPVVRISHIKYVTMLRGETTCKRKGF